MNARVAFNATDAAAIALSAGMDQTMGGGLSPTITLPGIATGEISPADVERACANVLTAKFAAGLFDGVLPGMSHMILFMNGDNAMCVFRSMMPTYARGVD